MGVLEYTVRKLKMIDYLSNHTHLGVGVLKGCDLMVMPQPLRPHSILLAGKLKWLPLKE